MRSLRACRKPMIQWRGGGPVRISPRGPAGHGPRLAESVPAGVVQPPVGGRAGQRRIPPDEIERCAAIPVPRVGIGPGQQAGPHIPSAGRPEEVRAVPVRAVGLRARTTGPGRPPLPLLSQRSRSAYHLPFASTAFSGPYRIAWRKTVKFPGFSLARGGRAIPRPAACCLRGYPRSAPWQTSIATMQAADPAANLTTV